MPILHFEGTAPYRFTLSMQVCPDDYLCYHGRCNVDGHCDCDPGYTADDCSIGPFFVPSEKRAEPCAGANATEVEACRRAALA